MNELEHYVKKLLAKEAVEKAPEFIVLDGGSFEINVQQKDGKIQKLDCYHSFGNAGRDRAMNKMRKLLKEDYFLKKYGEELRSF